MTEEDAFAMCPDLRPIVEEIRSLCGRGFFAPSTDDGGATFCVLWEWFDDAPGSICLWYDLEDGADLYTASIFPNPPGPASVETSVTRPTLELARDCALWWRGLRSAGRAEESP